MATEKLVETIYKDKITHQIFSELRQDSISGSKGRVLKVLRKGINRAPPDKKRGKKHITLYYTGHSEKNTGNWIYPDGILGL